MKGRLYSACVRSIMPYGKELWTRLKLNSMRECLQDRRLQRFGHLERMEENAWSNKCRTFRVSGSSFRG